MTYENYQYTDPADTAKTETPGLFILSQLLYIVALCRGAYLAFDLHNYFHKGNPTLADTMLQLTIMAAYFAVVCLFGRKVIDRHVRPELTRVVETVFAVVSLTTLTGIPLICFSLPDYPVFDDINRWLSSIPAHIF